MRFAPPRSSAALVRHVKAGEMPIGERVKLRAGQSTAESWNSLIAVSALFFLWPFVGSQHSLAQTNTLRSYLHQFIVANELDRLLERSSFGGTRRIASSAEAARMLVSFFSLMALTSKIDRAGVFTDDHAFIDLDSGTSKQSSALL